MLRRTITSRSVARLGLAICCLLALVTSSAFSSTPPDRYDGVITRLDRLDKDRHISMVKIGSSIKGRPIFAITLDQQHTDLTNDRRARLLVICGQHGDEPLPVYASLKLIDSLLRDRPNALNDVVLTFIPTVNPDGFVSHKRVNAAGVDLNRDWQSPSQPETTAITTFINRFRPHVLIDEHEWVKDDPYRPNCIETANFGHHANERLARTLARNLESQLLTSDLGLTMTHFSQESDQRMAHRRFSGSGICSMLVETSPDWPSAKRTQIYNKFVISVMTTLASPQNAIVENDISFIKSKRPYAIAWTGYDNASSKLKNSPISPYWIALLTGTVFILAKSAAPRKKKQNNTSTEPAIFGSRSICFSEAVQSDAPMHTRLEIIHQLRVRPSDRPQISRNKT